MVKSSRKIKLSKNMKPFVGRVVRAGKVQKYFAVMTEEIQKCVATGVQPGMSGGAIHKIVSECAKTKAHPIKGMMGFVESPKPTLADKQAKHAAKVGNLAARQASRKL